MSKFRKKPVEVEAVKVVDLIRAKDSGHWPNVEIPHWAIDANHEGVLEIYGINVEIVTLEGTMTGDIDDWIIQGVKGELYPCKPDIFAATYDPVS